MKINFSWDEKFSSYGSGASLFVRFPVRYLEECNSNVFYYQAFTSRGVKFAYRSRKSWTIVRISATFRDKRRQDLRFGQVKHERGWRNKSIAECN